jgi:long-chain acyl-CoA synthetase
LKNIIHRLSDNDQLPNGKNMPPLEKLTLRALIQRSATAFADQPALSAVNGQVYTYATLFSHVQTVSHLLRSRGVVAGDRVALLSENNPQWGIAYLAITKIGFPSDGGAAHHPAL